MKPMVEVTRWFKNHIKQSNAINKSVNAIGISLIVISLMYMLVVMLVVMPVLPSGVYNAPNFEFLHEGSRSICIVSSRNIAYVIIFNIIPEHYGTDIITIPGKWEKDESGCINMEFFVAGQPDVVRFKVESYWWGMFFCDKDNNNQFYLYRTLGNVDDYF